jgi:hypothetical protein
MSRISSPRGVGQSILQLSWSKIRLVSRKTRDKPLSHNQRDKTANNVELRLKRHECYPI